MGLDAYVRCRCWEDGLCNPPPSLAPRLRYDPVTAEVDQVTPENLSAEEVLALDLEYDLWVMEGACTHESMCIAAEHISNWGGVREFQQALRSLGPNSYAALLREIPNRNGGSTKPADARLCLGELDRFCSTGSFGQVVELVDAGSGRVLHSRVGPYDGWLGTAGTTSISQRLSADGTFQVERGRAGVMQHDPDAEVLFRSEAFSQEKAPDGDFCFTDLSSGERVVFSLGVQDTSGLYPTLLKVKQSQDTPDRYAYCVAPLRRVFQVAIDTGHPVLWS